MSTSAKQPLGKQRLNVAARPGSLSLDWILPPAGSQRLTGSWMTILNGSLFAACPSAIREIDVRYEDVVADLEGQARRINRPLRPRLGPALPRLSSDRAPRAPRQRHASAPADLHQRR